MNPKDLQIGNWVRIDSSPMKVIRLTENFVDLVTLRGNEIHTVYGEIQPIDITENILFANNFKKEHNADGEGIDAYTYIIEPFPDAPEYIRVWYGNGHFMMTNIVFIKTHPYSHRGKLYDAFQYVHELQQAINLCGYDKIADNFKID